MNAQFDYVIVGGGSAGCVLANRLSADPATRVLLLEAGGDGQGFWVRIPAGFQKLLTHPTYNWCFETEPEDNVKGRRIPIPRGKGLGGSGVINGMLQVRGQPLDYNTWAALGNRGWSFDEVLPYFKRAERFARGGDALRGGDGPFHVMDMIEHHPLVDAFIEAGVQTGGARNPDYNGASQDGFGYYQVTQRDGRRENAATAYLDPVRSRPNLEIVTQARATRILIEGKRAVGVAYSRNGTPLEARAARSVIVSAGAVQSPQLLEVSGIGNPDLLAKHGIPVAHALPGVGENYRDHYAARMVWRVKQPITLNETTRGWRLAREVLKYFVAGRGVLTYPAGIGHGFVRSREGLDSPDCQMFFAHGSFTNPKTRAFDREPGMTIGIYQCRPESRGSIHAGSKDPSANPLIRPNFLSESLDQQTLVAGIRIMRRIGAAPAFDPFRSHEVRPGPDKTTDEDLLDYARNTGATTYHPMGTCKMGTDADPMAVVDEKLSVRGLEGLRVIDASVMPTMPSGNINAAVLMVAEKGAEMLLRG